MPAVEPPDSKQPTPDAEERNRRETERWEQLRLAAKKQDRPPWFHDKRPFKRPRLEMPVADWHAEQALKMQAANVSEKKLKQTQDLKEIIAKAEAQARAEEERKAAEAAEAAAKAKARQEKLEKWEKRKAEKAENGKEEKKKKRAPALSAEEKEKLKEKRLMKLIGAVVVKCMTKYAKGLSKEMFKKYAKEVRPFSPLSHYNVSKQR